jgi:hypothetical protein
LLANSLTEARIVLVLMNEAFSLELLVAVLLVLAGAALAQTIWENA